jgi:hypothetical protein
VKAPVVLTKRATRATVNVLKSFIVRFDSLCSDLRHQVEFEDREDKPIEKTELQHDGNLET